MGNAKISNNIFGNEFIIWNLIKKAKGEGYNKLEITGANKKNLCQFKSKFNPSIELCYSIRKKSNLGRLAEMAYHNYIRRT